MTRGVLRGFGQNLMLGLCARGETEERKGGNREREVKTTARGWGGEETDGGKTQTSGRGQGREEVEASVKGGEGGRNRGEREV